MRLLRMILLIHFNWVEETSFEKQPKSKSQLESANAGYRGCRVTVSTNKERQMCISSRISLKLREGVWIG